ncbi:MAG: phosphatidylserine decarboxylase [Candidatus Thorarchaeota archaeon]
MAHKRLLEAVRFAPGHKIITIPLAGLFSAIFFLYVWLNHVFLLVALFLSAVLLIFVLWFFRDPERHVPEGTGVVAPADGKVFEIAERDGLTSVNIMMSLFDVHVTRMPLTGRVLSIEKKPGSYLPMLPFYTKISRKNARQKIKIEVGDFQIETVQISGFIARRCVCYHEPGTVVPRGNRLGIIRFGSEVDTSFPSDKFRVSVKIGQNVRAGETLIAVEHEKAI